MKRLLCILLLIVIICCSACQKNEPTDHSASADMTATGESNITNQTEEISEEELAKKVAEQLDVPDCTTYKVGNRILWTDAQHYVTAIHITFYERGDLVASACVDPTNGDLLQGSFKYKKPNYPLDDKSFSPVFFGNPDGISPMSDAELKSAISNIPSEGYEAYPDTHGRPLSATLYKNGQTISIDVNDPRLVRLTNFFNNCVYYSKCGYLQGQLSLDSLEKNVFCEDFRLELKYEPYGDKGPGAYSTSTSMCDMIVVSNSVSGFTLIAHDLPGYKGAEDEYPFQATYFWPLYHSYQWLDLFDF